MSYEPRENDEIANWNANFNPCHFIVGAFEKDTQILSMVKLSDVAAHLVWILQTLSFELEYVVSGEIIFGESRVNRTQRAENAEMLKHYAAQLVLFLKLS